MNIAHRVRSAVLIASVQLCVLFGAQLASAQTPRIPWDKSLTVTRTSSDEDIKTVLRSLLQANGVSVIFGPEVRGNVSFRLDKVPISTAFEQLVDEHNLAYQYDAPTNTVAISSVAEGDRAKPTSFVPLDQVTYGEVTRAMESFGLSSSGVKYDSGTRTVAISGDMQHVQEIADLIKTLETSHQKQRDRLGADRTRELQLKRAELAQQAYEDLKKFEVKVIPLRFTDVGPTTKQFQGRTVTIPGIMDTLTSILGISPIPQGAAPPPATAPSALGPDMPGDVLPDATLLGEAQQLGHPRISIDQRTNSVVVQGSPEAIAAVEKIIRALDRPLQMVQIEVTIAQADLGVARQLGVDWRGSAFNADGTPLSGAIDTGTNPPHIGNDAAGSGFNTTGLDALSLLPLAATPGQTTASFVVKGAEGALQAQLQALASKDRARILSQPRLVTLDNITARITRSQNIFVQVDTRSPQGGGLGGVGLQEIQTGLTLEITPSIVPAETDRSEALVRLNLRAENSTPGAGVFGQIDVKSQEVQTNVLVPDGATFVIGGLFDDSQIISESGVPGLKDIPLLGALFRNSTKSKSLGETIFFITPHLVDERTVLQDDIAVKVGSEDYIRRQRRTLSTEVHDPANADSLSAPASPLSALDEDE